jgi:hypothetical protein
MKTPLALLEPETLQNLATRFQISPEKLLIMISNFEPGRVNAEGRLESLRPLEPGSLGLIIASPDCSARVYGGGLLELNQMLRAPHGLPDIKLEDF